MSLELFNRAFPILLNGLWITVILTFLSVAIGFNLGLGLAIMRLTQNHWLAGFAKYYSSFFRGTPLIVQLFLIYYGLGQLSFVKQSPSLWWVISDGTRCAVLSLALNTAAYTSEILRGGMMSIPSGLIDAAKATGMSPLIRFCRIEFPLAIRQALPAYGNELILVVKGTSLASTITVLEITGYAKRLMSQTFAIFEVFAIAGLIYLAFNLLLVALIRTLEYRLTRYQYVSR